MTHERDLNTKKDLLQYITAIGTSLRIRSDVDVDALLKQVADATCEALSFRHSALYLADTSGFFRVHATSGISPEDDEYLLHRPLPEFIVSRFTQEEFLISSSYLVPTEASVWQDVTLGEFFVVPDKDMPLPPSDLPDRHRLWLPTDLLIVPFRGADNTLLGFLTPDGPLDGLRPNAETIAILELFANQATVVIEGTQLYAQTQQVSEERAALIEISRSLFAPEALYDLNTVYRTIHEQVRRVLPAECFFVGRYYEPTDNLIIDFLVDEGTIYPKVDFGGVAPWMRKLLSKAKPSYLFLEAREYEDFMRYHSEQPARRLIGNLRPSHSLIFVPIHYGNEAIGMLSVQSYQPHVYSQHHVDIFKEIAVQAGIAITNARFYTELREAVARAQESEQLKNQFLMTASHELRTPLTAIQGYLELLSAQGHLLDEDRKQRFINNAYHACEELVLLLGNMMDASLLDQNWGLLQFSHVQVLDAVQRILEILEPTIAREKRPVTITVDPSLTVWADDLRLRQVLLNIVGNALKYTPTTTKIAISATQLLRDSLSKYLPTTSFPLHLAQASHFILLEVRDWGHGIPPTDQHRLFTRFTRLSNSRESRGSGWGLYLCRQLVIAMGGHIWFESTGIPDDGTSFYIALPQSPA